MASSRIEFIARGVIVRENAVLICKNLNQGYGYLPGGHVEFGEPAAEALRRELIEETGVNSTVGPLIAVHEESFLQGERLRHEVNLMFHVEHFDDGGGLGSVPSREDHIGFEWLDLAGVTSADIRPTSIRAFLAAGGQANGTAAWWSVFPSESGGAPAEPLRP